MGSEIKTKLITGAAFVELVDHYKSQVSEIVTGLRKINEVNKVLDQKSNTITEQSNKNKETLENLTQNLLDLDSKLGALKDNFRNYKEITGESLDELRTKVVALGDLRAELNGVLSTAKQELNKRVDDELNNFKTNVIPEALSELKRKSESDIRKAQNEIGNAVDAAKSDVYNHYNELRRDLWQKVNTQDTKIDSFEGKLEDITKEISKNSSKDSEIKTKVSVLENTVQSLRQDLWEKVSSQDDKFTSTNNRLNEIENKAVENSNRDSELRGKLEVYENQLNVLRTENITLQGKNEELSNKLAVLGGKMLQVIDNLNELKGKVEAGADNKLSKSDIKEIFEEIYG